MRKVYLVLFILTVVAVGKTQAGDLCDAFKGEKTGMNIPDNSFIKGCIGNSVNDELPAPANTTYNPRSFYPANSLNVLKKALYA